VAAATVVDQQVARDPRMQNDLTRGRRILFSSVLAFASALLLFAILETAAYYVMVAKELNFYLPIELSSPFNLPENPPRPNSFSYELGWEPQYPNDVGYIGVDRDISNAAFAVFGDSYTEAHPEIEKSWPYQLEQKLQRPVLNFGVGGYGTDQAYLRFEKRFIGKLNTPYVGLFVMSENIARIVNRFRGY
jgi:hypothetical protein